MPIPTPTRRGAGALPLLLVLGLVAGVLVALFLWRGLGDERPHRRASGGAAPVEPRPEPPAQPPAEAPPAAADTGARTSVDRPPVVPDAGEVEAAELVARLRQAIELAMMDRIAPNTFLEVALFAAAHEVERKGRKATHEQKAHTLLDMPPGLSANLLVPPVADTGTSKGGIELVLAPGEEPALFDGLPRKPARATVTITADEHGRAWRVTIRADLEVDQNAAGKLGLGGRRTWTQGAIYNYEPDDRRKTTLTILTTQNGGFRARPDVLFTPEGGSPSPELLIPLTDRLIELLAAVRGS